MTWTLELWVEGPTDATESAADDLDGGVLPIVTHRTLQDRSALPAETYKRVVEDHVRVKPLKDCLRGIVSFRDARGWAGKAAAALSIARVKDPSAIVLLFRDCDECPERLKERDQANDLLHQRGESGVAVAVCVQAVEAWLLADPAAFRACYGRGPASGLSSKPETDSTPKSTLRDIVGSLRDSDDDESWSTLCRQLAEEVSLEVLAASCATGYGAFQRDVDRLIAPSLRR